MTLKPLQFCKLIVQETRMMGLPGAENVWWQVQPFSYKYQHVIYSQNSHTKLMNPESPNLAYMMIHKINVGSKMSKLKGLKSVRVTVSVYSVITFTI